MLVQALQKIHVTEVSLSVPVAEFKIYHQKRRGTWCSLPLHYTLLQYSHLPNRLVLDVLLYILVLSMKWRAHVFTWENTQTGLVEVQYHVFKSLTLALALPLFHCLPEGREHLPFSHIYVVVLSLVICRVINWKWLVYYQQRLHKFYIEIVILEPNSVLLIHCLQWMYILPGSGKCVWC